MKSGRDGCKISERPGDSSALVELDRRDRQLWLKQAGQEVTQGSTVVNDFLIAWRCCGRILAVAVGPASRSLTQFLEWLPSCKPAPCQTHCPVRDPKHPPSSESQTACLCGSPLTYNTLLSSPLLHAKLWPTCQQRRVSLSSCSIIVPWPLSHSVTFCSFNIFSGSYPLAILPSLPSPA